MSNALRKLRRRAEKYDAVPLWVKQALPVENKLSEAIQLLAQPLLDSARDGADYRLILVIATLCWNLSLMPKDKRPSLIKDILDKAVKPGESPREAEQIVEFLLSRKETLFPDDKRVILDHTFVGEGREIGFFVKYATDQPPSMPSQKT
jgi:hypothetical protein